MDADREALLAAVEASRKKGSRRQRRLMNSLLFSILFYFNCWFLLTFAPFVTDTTKNLDNYLVRLGANDENLDLPSFDLPMDEPSAFSRLFDDDRAWNVCT